ncbi:MAG: response regulator, partial [Planctomycetes bacterium]|nr:response regulator [Planctomycetota bacterium]
FHCTAWFGALLKARGLTLRPDDSLAPARLAPAPSQRSLRILLAEDNVINQKLVVLLLRKQGHVVAVAGDGREALEVLEQQPFDLVLMDMQMPEMDGIEATAIIREKEKETGRHLPIIALTAHAMIGDRDSCLAAGMDGYVSKPFQEKELRQAIEDLFPSEG